MDASTATRDAPASNNDGIPNEQSPSNDIAAMPDSYQKPGDATESENLLRNHLEDLQHRDPHHYPPNIMEASSQHTVSTLATKIYTLSYLVLFSIFGTLARVGLTALTSYHGAPVFSTVWANVGGSFIMGFLTEDRMLFRHEWGRAVYDEAIRSKKDGEDLSAAKKAHLATKKTIPLYIGLATGFCGSFTSFSTFLRDAFLAASNDLPVPGSGFAIHRNGGYSFMALLGVLVTDITLSLGAYTMGTHLAAATEGLTPSLPFRFTRKVLDRLAVVLGWGCWLGAIFLCIFPPHKHWRGQITFALVFAPIGCLGRFYLAMYLNAKRPSFPLGTFAANIIGTTILAIGWDVAHIPAGGVITCQVMQGLEDGLCGCLTTVSTWVAELHTLRRRHSYIYGAVSVITGFALMIIIMGSLRWSHGFHPPHCKI